MYRGINLHVVILAIMFVMGGFAMTGLDNNVQAMQNSSVTMGSQQTAQENAALQSNEENLTKAHESFLKKDYKATAEYIRKTVAFMKTEESKASSSGKKMLKSSINELDKMSDQVEKGSMTSVNTLDKAFANAREAIANSSKMKTAEKKTSKIWQKTSSGLKHGLSWTGNKIGAGASAVAKGTGFILGKAIEGTGWVSKKTGSVINSAGLKVEHFGKNIQPQKQAAMTQQ